MPIIKSAAKRARQTSARTARNVQVKKKLKLAIKEFEAAIATKSKSANAKLNGVYGAIDTAVKKNLMHKNRGARLKSNYAAKVKTAGIKLETGKATAKPTPTKKSTAKKTTTKKK